MNSNNATALILHDNPSPPTIKIRVRSQDGDKYLFEMRRSAALMKIYCQKSHFPYETIAFLHDGRRVDPTKTPDEITIRLTLKLGLEDFDEIDAMMHRAGGGGGGYSI